MPCAYTLGRGGDEDSSEEPLQCFREITEAWTATEHGEQVVGAQPPLQPYLPGLLIVLNAVQLFLTSGPLHMLTPLLKTLSPPSASLPSSHSKGYWGYLGCWEAQDFEGQDGVRSGCPGIRRSVPGRDNGSEQDPLRKLRPREPLLPGGQCYSSLAFS